MVSQSSTNAKNGAKFVRSYVSRGWREPNHHRRHGDDLYRGQRELLYCESTAGHGLV
jgi:hypothetical protein